MYTLTEIRQDVSSHQLERVPPNIINSNTMNTTLSQNRGGGDTVPVNNFNSTIVEYLGQQNTINNNVQYLPCRNTDNYTQLERNDVVRQLWRQQTQTSIDQRPENNLTNYQTLFSAPHCTGSLNNFERLEHSQQFQPNYANNCLYNRNVQLNNNLLLQQNQQRNYIPAMETHNMLQQSLNQTSFMNYTSTNASNIYPNTISSNSAIPPSFIPPPIPTQFNNYQTTIAQQNNQHAIVFPPNTNYTSIPPPPPPPPIPLVFGPPPRERRSNINIDGPKPINFSTNLNNINNSPSIPIQTFFQSFSNRMKAPTTIENEKLITKTLPNKATEAVLNHFNSTSNNCPNLAPCSGLQLLDIKENNFDENVEIRTGSNIKLKFGKNVVNIPKKIENEGKEYESSLVDRSKVDLSNSFHQKTINNATAINENKLLDSSCENMFNCQQKLTNDLETNLKFLFNEDNAFIDMVIEGCLIGAEIATKYQNVPCFKNIKKLCEKTKNDLMTPHCTARNIHSQGIPWATKDCIFAFTRLTSCWYLLKGYLGEKSDVFEKIEELYSPDLRKSFALWERTTIALAFHLMKSFIALGNNSTYKWNPRAHSTPTFNVDCCQKKFTPIFTNALLSTPNSFINSNSTDSYCSPKETEIKILTKSTIDTPNSLRSSTIKTVENSNKNPKSHIQFKPILQLSSRYPDIDSGDEDMTKKYIKPGCYNVPQIHNNSKISSNSESSSKSSKKLNELSPPIKLLTHKNEANFRQNNSQSLFEINDSCSHEEYKSKKSQEIIDTTRQGVDLQNNYNSKLKHFFDQTFSKKFETITNNLEMSRNTNQKSVSENLPEHYNLTNTAIQKDNIMSDNVTTNEKPEQIKQNFNEYRILKSNKTFDSNTRELYENLNTAKSSPSTTLRRSIIITTKRPLNAQDFRKSTSKSTTLKHTTHNNEKYDSSLLKLPRNFHDDHNKNIKTSAWYSRNRYGGLSHLAVQTFERILNELWNMPNSHYFVFEVDVRDIPDYYDIVEHPMFLINILQKLTELKYNNLNQVVHDFRKIFRNARLFLGIHPDNKLENLTTNFSNVFEQLLGDNFPRMDFSSITGEPYEMQSSYSYSDQSGGESSPNSQKISSRSSTPSKSDNTPSSQEDR